MYGIVSFKVTPHLNDLDFFASYPRKNLLHGLGLNLLLHRTNTQQQSSLLHVALLLIPGLSLRLLVMVAALFLETR